MSRQYETVIGLEVHVELSTETKIFCGCPARFGGDANAYTCPVCMGLPGALPVLNKQVVELALRLGLATNCTITPVTSFDRKNYFYPDNPQNYQISQLYLPIAREGYIDIWVEKQQKRIRIHEMHMEEDAGKLFHDDNENISLVDYNRSGVPLVEIVSKPDMHSPKEVMAYLSELRLIIQYLNISDCKLQEGSMRVDVNLSVHEIGSKKLGNRTEMKNLNSFKAIRRAIEGEGKRQIEILGKGGKVKQETRRWDDDKGVSYSMRTKEETKDYRYFPEPDLPPVTIDEDWVRQVSMQQPELPQEKRRRYEQEFGLPPYDVAILTETKQMAELFERTSLLCHRPKQVSNWLMGEGLRLQKGEGKDTQISIRPEYLAKLIQLTEKKIINNLVAKEIFLLIATKDVDPEVYVSGHGLIAVKDEDTLKRVIEEVIENNPKSVSDYRNGKEKAISFLIGQTMKVMQGKARPDIIHKILKELL